MTRCAAALTTLLTTVLLGAASAQATTRFVTTGGSDAGNSCMGSPCRTIQHAVDRAAAGDTVLIGSGTFAEAVTVDKWLTITGAGSASPFVDASGTSSPAFTLGDADLTLTDMHVRGGVKPDSKGGVVVPAVQGGGPSAPSITLDHVLADQANPTNPDKWDHTLGFSNSAGTARLTVTDSEVDGYQAAIGIKPGVGGSLTVQRSKITVPPFASQATFEAPFTGPQGDVISAVPVTITDSVLAGYGPVTLKNIGATITRTTITGVGAGILLYDDPVSVDDALELRRRWETLEMK